ncbi:hypothetical protein B7P34_23080 [Streptosporangium nondiastaticum]|uniref:DNA ligase D 3'-phosphoesterase domain-containing protein n=1 Tax=Streptosporangium nondiastaticum TaxID=35764 RepID=A0A9X7JMW7_9ACTN|nr:DNA polymerase ligase N-terminal domain-containing protein [Streptosporangium nondiastaticum]PSJ26371.1 hypothetical protein B7P34_23080 [Streptosporangium nondiastaticum]
MTSRKSEAPAEALAAYRRKRDFTKTAEPSGAGKAGGRDRAAGGQPSFVVQIHDATTTHFDFRLEADGVLKSWAVPKGPSRDPQEKRLAMPTEDHPLSYRTKDKHADAAHGSPDPARARSALTGRTLRQVAREGKQTP